MNHAAVSRGDVIVRVGALTVKVNGVPATMVAGVPVTLNLLAAVGLTAMLSLEADRWELTSVAVTVCVPALVSLTLKVPVPLASKLLPGRLVWAFVSLLVKATVPV